MPRHYTELYSGIYANPIFDIHLDTTEVGPFVLIIGGCFDTKGLADTPIISYRLKTLSIKNGTDRRHVHSFHVITFQLLKYDCS